MTNCHDGNSPKIMYSMGTFFDHLSTPRQTTAAGKTKTRLWSNTSAILLHPRKWSWQQYCSLEWGTLTGHWVPWLQTQAVCVSIMVHSDCFRLSTEPMIHHPLQLRSNLWITSDLLSVHRCSGWPGRHCWAPWDWSAWNALNSFNCVLEKTL